MKKILFCLVALAACQPRTAIAATVNFEGSRVVVSTVPTSPTRIFTADSSFDKSVVYNDSGYNLVLSTSSVSVSTNTDTGGFYVPHGTIFDFTGQESFRGDLWGVISGTDVPKSVGRIRTK